jgi:hypothetical protein
VDEIYDLESDPLFGTGAKFGNLGIGEDTDNNTPDFLESQIKDKIRKNAQEYIKGE